MGLNFFDETQQGTYTLNDNIKSERAKLAIHYNTTRHDTILHKATKRKQKVHEITQHDANLYNAMTLEKVSSANYDLTQMNAVKDDTMYVYVSQKSTMQREETKQTQTRMQTQIQRNVAKK